jgi:sulfide:quinone oxidoreductase
MDIRTLSHDLSVSPQIRVEDLQAIQARGFRSILCNRPDQEDDDQPSFDEIARAARRLGLEAHFQPVMSGQVDADDVDDFRQAIDELPGPVLAYCRTGTRCAILWARAQAGAGSMTVPEVLAATRHAGYELQGL